MADIALTIAALPIHVLASVVGRDGYDARDTIPSGQIGDVASEPSCERLRAD